MPKKKTNGIGTAYLVVLPSLHYNDEIHYQEGDMAPDRVYLSKAAAEEARKQANVDIFKDYNLTDFGFSFSELTSKNVQSAAKQLEALGMTVNTEDMGDMSPRNLSVDVLDSVLKILDKIPQAYIAEVPIEGTGHDVITAFKG